MPFYKRLQYNSPMVLTYALAALLLVVLNNATQGESNRLLFSVYRSSFADPLMYIRVFTHALGHMNFTHFFENIIIILLIGPMLEEKYGSRRLGLMFLITAFVTGLLFMAVAEQQALLGGSGLVFMLILLSSFTNLRQGRVPLTLILVFAIFIGREVVTGATVESNISHMTHIVGGVCGGVFGLVLNKRALRLAERREPRRELPREPLREPPREPR